MSSETRTTASGTPVRGSQDHDRSPGELIAGRYRIVALLGRGGMGEVYRVEDLKLRHPVALKFLPARLQSDPSRLARFHREVRLAREVTHPNVCRVHDIGEVDGLHFLSMEYVDGEDLASLLRRIGRLPRDKALEVARQVCAGVAAAHDRGVVHRDLKPANVMIDGRGRVRITDFGLAVAEEEHADGEVAGTPGYMAPEQLAGEPASVRSDIYALGLVLYEVVTGRAAFTGRSASEILRLQRDSTPAPPSSFVPDLEPSVERVILRCLERDPRHRPPSALAVAAALPGGDPLAALVAAGETPPPEMVADAGGSGALRPAVAWALLGSIAVSVPLALWLLRGMTVIGPVALDKPPEVLAERAREFLSRQGHPPTGYEASAFAYDRTALAGREWSRAVRFWHRLSPEPLRPRNPVATVSPDDPPLLTPGMATVWLDAHGRLLTFHAVPPPLPAAPTVTPEWAPFFAEAGLDFSRFAPAEPSHAPPVGADALAAWTGADASTPPRTVAVEAAAWRGRPVFFAVLEDAEAAARTPGARYAARVAFGLLNLAILVAAAVFAWRNLRHGRGDRQGAARLAMVALVASLLSWAAEMSSLVYLDRVWRFILSGAQIALWNAAYTWVFYLAIEPFVRRRWPESLISWSRLLAGRLRDPRVGRDVLVGLAAWGFLVLIVIGVYRAPRLWGEGTPLAPGDLSVATGLQPLAAWFLDGATRSLSFCMSVLTLLLLMRTLFRRLWAGVLAVGLVFGLVVTPAVVPGAHWTLTLGVLLILVAVLALLARFGLLAMAVLGFFVDPFFPICGEPGAWYGRATAALIAFTAVAAVYGFLVSLGGRSPFGEGAVEE